MLTEGARYFSRRTYDKIGNRISETRDAATENYGYTPSATGGRNPKLTAVGVGTDDETRYFFDAAGYQTYKGDATEKNHISYDALSRMSQVTTDSIQTAGARVSFFDDGEVFDVKDPRGADAPEALSRDRGDDA